eukprot:88733_1
MNYLWFTVVLIGLSVAFIPDIDKTVSIECDLGAVAVGEEVLCPFTVQEADLSQGGPGGEVTVRTQVELIDSTGSSSTFCENARVSIVYLNGDYGGSNEYMNLYEGLTTDPAELLQECPGNGVDHECEVIDCPEAGGDVSLSGSYGVGSSVDLTMFVSDAVDGVHWNGRILCNEDAFKIDSTVTFKCTKAVDACGARGHALRHDCSCESQCDGRFCNTLNFVEGKLGQSLSSGLCPGGDACCCSCQNCPGHLPYE